MTTMDGIENITAKIAADAQAEIDALTAQAQAEAKEIADAARAKADALAADLAEKGRKAAAEREERMASVAQLDARNVGLFAKQEMLDKAFDRALEKLCTLEDEAYIDLLAELLVKASRSGREQVVFNQTDRARVGKRVVMAANEALARKEMPKLPESLGSTKVGAFLDRMVQNAAALFNGNGQLTLSEQTRNIRGGFVMSDGSVETNCAFETLVRMQRQRLERQVAETLFN